MITKNIKMSHIYIIKNKCNNKCYIGQTMKSIEQRFKKHKSEINCKRKRCPELYSDFKKYGVENFYVESLFSGNFSREELHKLEISSIKKHNTLFPNGYNLQRGGTCSPLTSEIKKRISEALKGRKVTWGDKVSLSVKKLWENPEYRRRQTKQRHEKRGKYRKGIIKPLRLNLPIDELKKLYENGMNINSIAKKYKVSFLAIKKRVCRGKDLRKNGYKNLPKKEIQDLYKQGYSIKAIMEKYNVSFYTIKRRLDK